jgi:S-methylmethionine-dependent homocysteine/selenocysteine methylase
VSRWLSPEKGARRVARAAKEAARRRKEKQRSVLLTVAIAVGSVGLMVAEYFWLQYQAKQRHELRYHRGGKTNAPVSAMPPDGLHQAINHE